MFFCSVESISWFFELISWSGELKFCSVELVSCSGVLISCYGDLISFINQVERFVHSRLASTLDECGDKVKQPVNESIRCIRRTAEGECEKVKKRERHREREQEIFAGGYKEMSSILADQ